MNLILIWCSIVVALCQILTGEELLPKIEFMPFNSLRHPQALENVLKTGNGSSIIEMRQIAIQKSIYPVPCTLSIFGQIVIVDGKIDISQEYKAVDTTRLK